MRRTSPPPQGARGHCGPTPTGICPLFRGSRERQSRSASHQGHRPSPGPCLRSPGELDRAYLENQRKGTRAPQDGHSPGSRLRAGTKGRDAETVGPHSRSGAQPERTSGPCRPSPPVAVGTHCTTGGLRDNRRPSGQGRGRGRPRAWRLWAAIHSFTVLFRVCGFGLGRSIKETFLAVLWLLLASPPHPVAWTGPGRHGFGVALPRLPLVLPGLGASRARGGRGCHPRRREGPPLPGLPLLCSASGGRAALRGCFGLLKAYSNPERGTRDLLAPDTTLQTQDPAALTPGPRTGLSALTTAVLRAKAWDHPSRRADRAPPPDLSSLAPLTAHCHPEPCSPRAGHPARSQTLEPLPHAPAEVQTGTEDSQDAPSVPSQANTATSAAEVLGGRSGSFGLSSGSPKAEHKKLLKSCAPQRRDPSAPDIASQPPPLGLRTGTKPRRYPSSLVLRMGGKSGGPGLGERLSSRLCGGGAASSPTPPQGHGGPRGSPSLLRAHWSPCEKRPATRPPQLGGRTSR